MSEVKVNLNAKDEIALLDRYGRRCSRETLVKRALAEILKQQAEDIPIFVGKEEHEARLKAAEAQRVAEKAARSPSPEVMEILTRFRAGDKFVDEEGREVSNLQPANAHEGNPERLPLMAQFDGDNAEWHPVGLDELKRASVLAGFVPSIHTVPESKASQVPEGTKTLGTDAALLAEVRAAEEGDETEPEDFNA